MQLHVDPIARQYGCGVRAREEQRMARNLAKVVQDDGRSQLIGGLRGASANLQYLAKRAESVSSRFGSVITA